jgi:ADP-ribose pyrophosphatase YjhB (NUDIX family)
MPISPGLLARGPWQPGAVHAHWRETPYEPSAAAATAADAAIAALLARGSPSHDGVGARLISYTAGPDGLELELQPTRWALRLSSEDASQSVSATCVVRDSDGRWLAGRRAGWVAGWVGRWALGAGGSVDAGENPAATLTRELREEWSVSPASLSVEALLCLPQRLIMLVGMAWLAPGTEVVRDNEHDAHAWWPAQIDDWPAEAEEPVRQVAALLAS